MPFGAVISVTLVPLGTALAPILVTGRTQVGLPCNLCPSGPPEVTIIHAKVGHKMAQGTQNEPLRPTGRTQVGLTCNLCPSGAPELTKIRAKVGKKMAQGTQNDPLRHHWKDTGWATLQPVSLQGSKNALMYHSRRTEFDGGCRSLSWSRGQICGAHTVTQPGTGSPYDLLPWGP